jgi:hypothetical protein
VASPDHRAGLLRIKFPILIIIGMLWGLIPVDFTEKNSEGLMNLSLDASVKEAFAASKPIGKLLPLVFSITRVEQISEVMQVANYKKGLK